MLTLPRTAEYALRAVCYVAEHQETGPVAVPEIAQALDAPRNYLSKILHQLGGLAVLRSVRGVRGGYQLGMPLAECRLATIVEPFLSESEHHCIMGHARCSEESACGAHQRWMEVRRTAKAFFAELTMADLLPPSITGSITINDLLRRYPESAPILSRLGIDTCCGGGLALAAASEAAGLPVTRVLDELRPVLVAA